MIINEDLSHRVELKRRMESETPNEFYENLPHGFSAVEAPRPGQDCLVYATDIRNKRLFADDLFAMYDIVPEGQERPGDLVVYTNIMGDLRHAAVYRGDGKVVSKWGGNGPVLEHPIDHVPSFWGEVITFLRKPHPAEEK